MRTTMKSILVNIIVVAMVMAATSGKPVTEHSLKIWSSHRAARAAPAVRDDRMTFQLSPGMKQHIAFEVPIGEMVGSPSIDYVAELVTSRRCVHLLWTSAGRVTYWTTSITSERGCDPADDVAVEDYEEEYEKKMKKE